MEKLVSMATGWILQWPTWELIRALGFSAHLLLFIGIVSGIMQSMSLFSGKTKSLLFAAHTFSLRTGLLMILAHVLLLTVDSYHPFSWLELLIPLATESKPIAYGLGILAFYLILFLALNSEVISLFGKKRWHLLHLLAYPAFFAAMIHGITAGTDSSKHWAVTFYSATGGIILVLTVLRALTRKKGGNAHAHPSGRGRSQVGEAHPLQAGKRSP
ncbi:MAG: hypothetical protein BAA01_01945 [Bacillus thermozeamaize]|jgi:DMSO/TMAO reductase YedYZ heme-binding membrane subunit|uniref:Ferric oxidoreductase domain-containing protein n=1 Tax=Bacillus thermozeamaize TaxID=230954 RepID=A0A1Y3PFH5_9BACI|nr:MAG: hypothetical protein BAA01_01945 [Bacillus thermozeamaize]